MKKALIVTAVLTLSAAFFSCSSTPKEIPEMTSQELIQNGQTQFEAGNYKAALVYYETAIERFSDWPAVYVEARYETGHVYMRQKKYEKAREIFNEIITIYKNSAPGTLPAAYKKLSEIELAKIK